MKQPTPHFPRAVPRTTRRHERGVALVIALILLIVITIGSVVAMRSSLFTDMVSKNMRAQNLAMQSAEMALRYCEQQVAGNTAAINVFVLDDPTVANEWQTMANWLPANGRVNAVPAAYLGTTIDYETPPQCIVRRLSYIEAYGSEALPADATKPEDRGMSPDYLFFFRVTARGFSPDFQRDASGNSISGAEVWLQSMVRGFL